MVKINITEQKERRIVIKDAHIYLVKHKSLNQIKIAFITPHEVFFIDDGGSISHGTLPYIEKKYEVLKDITDTIEINVPIFQKVN